MKTLKARLGGDSGQALILGVFVIVLVLMMLGVVDLAGALAEYQNANAAAQTGALAGENTLMQGGSWDQAQTAAYTAVSKNGFPESDATIQQQGSGFEVKVSANYLTRFLPLIGIRSLPVQAVAESAGRYSSPNDYALLTLGGGGVFNNNSGALQVDGNAFSDAGIMNNGGTINVTGTLGMSGALSNNGGAVSGSGGVQQNQPPVPDPLAPYLQSPPPVPVLPPGPANGNCAGGGGWFGCTGQDNTAITFPSGTYANPVSIWSNGDQVTLSPGYYQGGITVNGTGDAITFQPGLYYIGGEGIMVQGTGDSLTGNGVMLYVASGGEATLNGTSMTVQLSAPTGQDAPVYSNAPAGILVWQSGSSGITINGDTGVQYRGTIYAPQSQLVINGGSESRILHGQVIVSSLNINGSNSITIGNQTGQWTAQVAAARLITPGSGGDN